MKEIPIKKYIRVLTLLRRLNLAQKSSLLQWNPHVFLSLRMKPKPQVGQKASLIGHLFISQQANLFPTSGSLHTPFFHSSMSFFYIVHSCIRSQSKYHILRPFLVLLFILLPPCLFPTSGTFFQSLVDLLYSLLRLLVICLPPLEWHHLKQSFSTSLRLSSVQIRVWHTPDTWSLCWML